MQTKSNFKKDLMEWRRSQVLEQVSKGSTLTEIANKLHVSIASISRDLSYLKEEAQHNIRNYVDKELPLEYEKCLMGINEIMRESWTAANNSDSPVEKRQWLVLAKECYSMKLDLLTNAGVIDKAIDFVNQKKSELSSTSDNKAKEKEKEEKKEIDIQGTSEENITREPRTANRTF